MAVGNSTFTTANMASGYALPPPSPLDIHGTQAADLDNWKRFKRAWLNYSLAIELGKKSEKVQVATLLTVIGEEAREVFATFADWESVVSRSQTSFLAQGVIACSISARTKKGSGMVHSADSFLTPPLVQRC